MNNLPINRAAPLRQPSIAILEKCLVCNVTSVMVTVNVALSYARLRACEERV